MVHDIVTMRGKDTHPSLRQRILHFWHDEQLTVTQIAKRIALPRTTVQSLVNRMRRSGLMLSNSFKKTGRPKKLNPRAERALARHCKRNPQATAKDAQQAVGTPAAEVSLRTIKRTLRRQNLICHRPRKAPSLSAKQKKVRLSWCQEKSHWSVADWRKVHFFTMCTYCHHELLFFSIR